VGAVTTDGSWYINRVMAEHLRIKSVALGKPMQRYEPAPPPARAIPVNSPAPAVEVEAEVRPAPLSAMPS
jgi:hypothetical protein